MDLSTLPSVDRLLKSYPVGDLINCYGHTAVRNVIREIQDEERTKLIIGKQGNPHDEQWLVGQCKSRLECENKMPIRPVYNLTGTVLHTNLGRALLPEESLEAIQSIISQPCNLEYDIESTSRGDRDDHLNELLCELTGAEAATVVNNNAAAVVLVLSALAKEKEVIVSRGELIEIGGSFRIPDIMSQAGSKLCEVGTTNRTHAKDYKNAINDNTALLMKVHKSNYKIEGFSSSVDEKELVGLGKKNNIPVVTDLGSGSLIDLTQWGLPKEPTIQQMVNDGVDIITFSGDKLLGGPQAGIIVGKKELISKIRQDPLKRALRLDKIIISALFAVLNLYRYPEKLVDRLPTLRLLTRSPSEIESLAKQIKPVLEKAIGKKVKIKIAECKSQIGSGSLPIESLPSFCITISESDKGRHTGSFLNHIAAAFANLPIPVIGRIKDDALCFDVRCLINEETFLKQIKYLKI